MDMLGHEARDADYNSELEYLISQFDAEHDPDKRKQLLYEIEAFAKMLNENSRVMLDCMKVRQHQQELDAADVVSDETNKARNRELDIREREFTMKYELEQEQNRIRESECTLKNEIESEQNRIRELESEQKSAYEQEQNRLRAEELKARIEENETKKREIAEKAKADAAKLEVEAAAVKGRVFGEVAKAAASVVGVVGTIVGIKGIMQFEKMDTGGIFPSKLINSLFKMTNI